MWVFVAVCAALCFFFLESKWLRMVSTTRWNFAIQLRWIYDRHASYHLARNTPSRCEPRAEKLECSTAAAQAI